MRYLVPAFIAMALSADGRAELQTQKVEYKCGDAVLGEHQRSWEAMKSFFAEIFRE